VYAPDSFLGSNSISRFLEKDGKFALEWAGKQTPKTERKLDSRTHHARCSATKDKKDKKILKNIYKTKKRKKSAGNGYRPAAFLLCGIAIFSAAWSVFKHYTQEGLVEIPRKWTTLYRLECLLVSLLGWLPQ
jgi:hypothetical protein